VKPKKTKANNLIKVENLVDYHQTLKVEDKTFEKLMFIYSIAMKEVENKIETFRGGQYGSVILQIQYDERGEIPGTD